MKKRILSLLIVFVMMIGLFPTIAFAASGFAGGSGTESDPYLISTKEQLNLVRNDLAAHYKLTCDIEFSDSDFKSGGSFYNGGQGFVPIGLDYNESFTGVFDGNGYAIKNLYIKISATGTVNVGLFGYSEGTIKNLGMVDSDISATSSSSAYIGGIAGRICGGAIQNCYNSGCVFASAEQANVGGIAGNNYSATIQGCYNTGIVSVSALSSSSMNFAGGIAGTNDHDTKNCYNTGSIVAFSSFSDAIVDVGGIVGLNYSTIQNCYNTGSVSASAEQATVGGIAGYNYSATIQECYNTGSISASSEFASAAVGGIVGGNTEGTIRNCYNIGTISGPEAGGIAASNFESTIQNCYNIGTISGPEAGGIAASNFYATIQNCYYLDLISKGVGNGTDTAVKCTAAQLKLQSTYEGFDFESTWIMGGSECYPFAKLQDMEHADHYFDNEQDYTCNCGYIDASRKFADVPAGAWFKQYVDYAIKNGIFSGTSATTFSPTKQMTRAQFVQVLANLSGIDTSNSNISSGFSDVPAGQWYTAAVTWAAQNGIVSGVGDGKFNPTGVVTRQQMCVIIVNYIENYLGKTLNDAKDTPSFADDSAIANWAKDAVYKCADAGLINGIGNNQFAPKNSATRAQGSIIFKAVHQEYILE